MYETTLRGNPAPASFADPADFPPAPNTQANRLVPPPFTPFTESDLSNAKLHPKCIVKNYLYADLGIACAAGGTGKTTILLYEAACIKLGHDVWGLPVIHPGATLFITAEDSRDLFAARLREILAVMKLSDSDRKHVLKNIGVWDVSGQMARLAQLDQSGNIQLTPLADDIVAAHQNSGLVQIVFDPAISFGPGERLINDGEQAIVVACRRIIRGLNCAVRLIAHTGKANARNGAIDQYAGRGGSAFPDGCRMVTILSNVHDVALTPPDAFELQPGDSGFVLARAKLSYTPLQPNIWIRRSGYKFDYFVEQTENHAEAMNRDSDKVESFLKEELLHGRRYSARAIEDSKKIGKITRQRLRAAITNLEVNGRVMEVELPKTGDDADRRGRRKTYLKPMLYCAEGHGAINPENAPEQPTEPSIAPTISIAPSYRDKENGAIKAVSLSPSSLNGPKLDSAITAHLPKNENGQNRLDGKEGLLSSLLATRILQCLDGDLAGLPEDSLVKAAGGKADDGLTRETINALLLAGRIGRVNGRLVAGGAHAQG